MRTYIILILLIAIAIPMAIKYGIRQTDVKTATGVGQGPCMINNFDNFSESPLQDRILPKNLDNMQKTDAFQQNLDNHPRDGMVNMDGFQEDTSNRVGQNCQFGQCLSGTQQSQNSQD